MKNNIKIKLKRAEMFSFSFLYEILFVDLLNFLSRRKIINMETERELIQKLKNHKVIQAIPELKAIVKTLEKQNKRMEKITDNLDSMIVHMSDGMTYNEAYEIVYSNVK